MKDSKYTPTKKYINVSVGESVKIIRELQGLSQMELAKLTQIPQGTISAIENDSIKVGIERVTRLARALKCHPGVIAFPGWNVEQEAA